MWGRSVVVFGAVTVLALLPASSAQPTPDTLNEFARFACGARATFSVSNGLSCGAVSGAFQFSIPARGDVRVYLPAALVGARVSARVLFVPSGTEGRARANLDYLHQCTMHWDEQKAALLPGAVSFIAREGAPHLSLQCPDSPVARAEVIEPIYYSPDRADVPLGLLRSPKLRWPALWQSDDALAVFGPFDGDLANTSVSDDRGSWTPLAETPGLLLLAPRRVEGSLQVTIRDGTAAAATMRIQLVKLDIRRELPDAAVLRITGLKGLRDTIEILLPRSLVRSVRLMGGGRPSPWPPKTTAAARILIWPRPDHRIRISPKSIPQSDEFAARLVVPSGEIERLSVGIRLFLWTPARGELVRQDVERWSSDNSAEVTSAAKSEIVRQFSENNDAVWERWTAVNDQFIEYRDFTEFVTRLYLYELRDRRRGPVSRSLPPSTHPFAPARTSSNAIDEVAARSFTLLDLLKTAWFRLLLKEAIVEIQSDPIGMMLAVDDQPRNVTNRILSFPVGAHKIEMQKDRTGCTCTVNYGRPGVQFPLVCKSEVSPECVRR